MSFSGLKILFRGQELLGGLKPRRKRGVLQKINEVGFPRPNTDWVFGLKWVNTLKFFTSNQSGRADSL